MASNDKLSGGEATFLLALTPFAWMLSGFTTAYLWNNFMVTALALPAITWVQGIGIDLCISWLTSHAASPKERDVYAHNARMFIIPLFFLAFGWIILAFTT